MKKSIPILSILLLISAAAYSQSPAISKKYVEGTYATYIINKLADSTIQIAILVPDKTQPSGFLTFAEADSTFIKNNFYREVLKRKADTAAANQALRNSENNVLLLQMIETEIKQVRSDEE